MRARLQGSITSGRGAAAIAAAVAAAAAAAVAARCLLLVVVGISRGIGKFVARKKHGQWKKASAPPGGGGGIFWYSGHFCTLFFCVLSPRSHTSAVRPVVWAESA